MSAGLVERWLSGLRDRRIEETSVSDEFCTRVRLWAELTPHLPAGSLGAWLLWREKGQVGASAIPGERVVGRGEDADVRVAYDWLSRRHFAIRPAAEGFELENIGGKNAVHLNGAATHRSPIKSGDVIRVGELDFLFVIA